MKITLNETTTHPVEHEVEFPVYMQHDVSDDRPNDIIYRRIDVVNGHLRLLEIHLHDHDWNDKLPAVELEVIEPYAMDARSGLDYNLGRGEFACSPEAFFNALEKAKHLVNLMQGAVEDGYAQKPLAADVKPSTGQVMSLWGGCAHPID